MTSAFIVYINTKSYNKNNFIGTIYNKHIYIMTQVI